MRKRQRETEFSYCFEGYRRYSALERRAVLNAPLPAVRIMHGRSWGGSAVCSEDGRQRLHSPGTRAYELMWRTADEG